MLLGIANTTPTLPPVARDGRVDPDQLAVDVHEGSAGIPGIDRRIGLNEILEVGHADIGPPHCAHDPKRHRPAQPERVSDRQHKLSHGQRAGVRPGHGRKIRPVYFDNGHIGLRIGGHDFPFILPPVGQNHFHIHRVGDDMVVRNNVPVRRDNHATLPVRRAGVPEQTERERLIMNADRGPSPWAHSTAE
jgi:hypothetical protein